MKDQQPFGSPRSAQKFNETSEKRRGCGCVFTGCAVVLFLLLAMCVGSYFVTMHSSLPLAAIEKALEAEGEVEIDGLTGSISKGFEIKSFKFKSDIPDQWNEFRNIKFRFNGFFDLAIRRRLIIKEATVDGATIYGKIDKNNELKIRPDVDGEKVANEVSDELDELRKELEDDKDLDQLNELSIELVQAKNIEIISPETDTRIEIKNIEFRNFRMLKGVVTRLGDLSISSDQLDVQSSPSKLYDDQAVSWNLKGNVKPGVNKSLLKEVPFELDFAIVGAGEYRMHIQLFNGEVVMDEPYGEHRTFVLKRFSPSESFDMKGRLSPSLWQAELLVEPRPDSIPGTERDSTNTQPNNEKKTRQETKKRAVNIPVRTAYDISIKEGSTFQLGETEFRIVTKEIVFATQGNSVPGFITATGMLNDKPVQALLTLQGDAPWFNIELTADGVSPKDLWSQLFFEKSFSELDPEDRRRVSESIANLDMPIQSIDF